MRSAQQVTFINLLINAPQMKYIRLQLAMLVILGSSLTAKAQWHYVADNIYGDSVRVFER